MTGALSLPIDRLELFRSYRNGTLFGSEKIILEPQAAPKRYTDAILVCNLRYRPGVMPSISRNAS